jgi:hypothetical protein
MNAHDGHDHAAAPLPPGRPWIGMTAGAGARVAVVSAVAMAVVAAAFGLDRSATPAPPAPPAAERTTSLRLRLEASWPTAWTVAINGVAVPVDAVPDVTCTATLPATVLVEAAGDDDGAARAVRLRVDGPGPAIDRTFWGQGTVVASVVVP